MWTRQDCSMVGLYRGSEEPFFFDDTAAGGQ